VNGFVAIGPDQTPHQRQRVQQIAGCAQHSRLMHPYPPAADPEDSKATLLLQMLSAIQRGGDYVYPDPALTQLAHQRSRSHGRASAERRVFVVQDQDPHLELLQGERDEWYPAQCAGSGGQETSHRWGLSLVTATFVCAEASR